MCLGVNVSGVAPIPLFDAIISLYVFLGHKMPFTSSTAVKT